MITYFFYKYRVFFSICKLFLNFNKKSFPHFLGGIFIFRSCFFVAAVGSSLKNQPRYTDVLRTTYVIVTRLLNNRFPVSLFERTIAMTSSSSVPKHFQAKVLHLRNFLPTDILHLRAFLSTDISSKQILHLRTFIPNDNSFYICGQFF